MKKIGSDPKYPADLKKSQGVKNTSNKKVWDVHSESKRSEYDQGALESDLC